MEYKKRIPQNTHVAVDIKKKKKIVSLEVTTTEVPYDGMMVLNKEADRKCSLRITM